MTGKAGTTDQMPRWEGPEENRPRGYLPANDDPSPDRDAAGENLRDPERRKLADAFEQGDRRGNDEPDPADELGASALEGATVYGSEDQEVGTISHIHGTGSTARIVVDVGGFLGIGAKPVAVAADDIVVMHDEAGKVYAATSLTRAELDRLPEHRD